MTLPFRSTLSRLMVGLAALALAGAACAPGGDADDVDRPDSKPASKVETDPSKLGDVTLKVWDQHTEGASNQALQELNKRFEQKYPNITIDRNAKSFDDLKTTLKLALSGDNPPDVVQANQGYPDMGAFVKAGLLTPMENYAKAYNWKERYPQQLLDLNTFSSDGSNWQNGDLWGVSQTGEIVGVYYNKKLLKKAGVEVPKTFDEFEAALPKLKKAGVLPIQFGTSDKSPVIHMLGVLESAIAGKEKARNLVTAGGPAKWNEPDSVKAVQKMQEWSKKGYITPGANGLSGDQATADFAEGKGAFFINGTWDLATIEEGLGSDAGFMLPPPAKPGGQSATLGGEGLAWSITSKTKNADAAAAYIKFITSDEAMDVVAEKGDLPVVDPPSYEPKAGLREDMFTAWDQVSENDGLVPYLDYATPSFYDTLTENLQQVIGGKMNAKSAADELEADFFKFKESR